MSRRSSRSAHALTAVAVVLVLIASTTARAQPAPAVRPPTELSLGELVELFGHATGIDIRYATTALDRPVRLRLDGPVGTTQLTEITHAALRDANLALISEDAGQLLHLVAIDVARRRSRTTDALAAHPATASFVSVARAVSPANSDSLRVAIGPIVEPEGAVVARRGGRELIVSGFRDDVARALDVVDAAALTASPVVTRIGLTHRSATKLAIELETVATSLRQAVGEGLDGAARPTADDTAILLIAPEHEQERWRSLIDTLDQPSSSIRRTYRLQYLAAPAIVPTLEASARREDNAGSGDDWSVVVDPLSNALIVTATAAEHDAITEALARLDTPSAAQALDVRRVTVRNRRVEDLVALVDAVLVGSTSRFDGVTSDGDGAAFANGIAPRGGVSGGGASGGDGGAAAPGRTWNDQPIVLAADVEGSAILVSASPTQVDRVEALIRELDVRQPQVLIETFVVTLTESDLFDLGIELALRENAGGTLLELFSLFQLGLDGVDASPGGSGSGLTGVVLDQGNFAVLLRALETISSGRTVTLPRTLVNNNAEATLDAVVQEPLLSLNASDQVATTSFAGTSDAGTQISVQPQIAAGDHLILDYAISLSSFVGDSTDPALPPPRQENSLASQVTIPDGHTVVVGGLELETQSEAESRIPILGEIPLVGELFKNRSTTRSRTRFFVFIRPTIIRGDGFEELKYLSDRWTTELGIDDGWPRPEPRFIR